MYVHTHEMYTKYLLAITYIHTYIHTYIVLGSVLSKSNSLHFTLYFESTLYITVTNLFEIKVNSNILAILDITFTQSCINISGKFLKQNKFS